MMDKLLTEKQVSEIVGFKRTRLFKMIDKGDFPPPKKYGRNNMIITRVFVHSKINPCNQAFSN